MFTRLQALGYTGHLSILKDFVHPLRPPKVGHFPVLRYETKPSDQLQFADFMAAIGVAPRVCKAYTPQTKGKIERSIGVIKQSFWPGVHFETIDDLNRQARDWCDERNRRVHRTIRQRPLERWAEEKLRQLPEAFAWSALQPRSAE